MLDLALPALVAAIVVIVAVAFAMSNARLFMRVLLHLLVLLIFCAGYLSEHVPIRIGAAGLLILLLGGLSAGSRTYARRPVSDIAKAGVGLGIIGGVALLGVWLPHAGSAESATLFRLVVMLPLAVAVGVMLRLRGHIPALRTIYAGWSLVFSCLAVIEAVRGKLFVTRQDRFTELVRSDHLRATLLAEHPLVLATLFVAAMAFVLANAAQSLRYRLVKVVVLGAGVWATGSRGAIALVAVVVVLTALRPVFARSPTLVCRLVVTVAFVGSVLYLSSAFTGDGLTGSSSDQASLAYRSILYEKLEASLETKPLGWGPAGLPAGVYTIGVGVGAKDLADTVDSEIVLLGFQFGWPGLLAFGAVVCWVAHPLRLRRPEGVAAMAVLGAGIYVAIHSWVGFPVLLAVLVGCIARLRPSGVSDQGAGREESRLKHAIDS